MKRLRMEWPEPQIPAAVAEEEVGLSGMGPRLDMEGQAAPELY